MMNSVCKAVTYVHMHTHSHTHTRYSVHQIIVLVVIRQLTDEITNKEESLNKHLRSVLQYTH